MNETIEMTVGISIALRNIADKILYEKYMTNDGTLAIRERKLPFRLKYRLGRNLTGIDKDVKWFNDNRTLLVAKYGEPNKDGTGVEITDPEKIEAFSKEINALLTTKTKHTVVRIDPSDLEVLTENLDISYDEIKLFIGFLSDEPELFKDLDMQYNIEAPTETPEEKEEEVKEEPVTPKKKTSKISKIERKSSATLNTKEEN